MAKRHKEITRYSEGGKTFFFNEGEARNGTRYLAINALYGKGNREQLVLFPGQMVEFYQKFKESMQAITGLGPTEQKFMQKCHKCNAGPAKWRILESKSGDTWVAYCSDCREIVFENVPNAWEDHLKEEYDDSGA